jgi:hypothetical protein
MILDLFGNVSLMKSVPKGKGDLTVPQEVMLRSQGVGQGRNFEKSPKGLAHSHFVRKWEPAPLARGPVCSAHCSRGQTIVYTKFIYTKCE